MIISTVKYVKMDITEEEVKYLLKLLEGRTELEAVYLKAELLSLSFKEGGD